MAGQIRFSDPPTTPEQQVDLLKSRGLIIDNDKTAAKFLSSVNYYRFCGYALNFEIFEDRKRTHRYKPDTNFRDIVAVYEFDSELRTILFSFIEHIEVAFRTAVCLELSLKYKNPHWYLDKNMYALNIFRYDDFISNCKEEFEGSKEIFAVSYKDKYDEPKMPPSWMLAEIISLGKWSKVFSGLKNLGDQKIIARRMNTTPFYLKSWMHGISFLRNLCAHHCRIWNRNFTTQMKITDRQLNSLESHEHLAAYCTVMADLLTSLERKSAFRDSLIKLFSDYPSIPINKMGFAENWQNSDIWRCF